MGMSMHCYAVKPADAAYHSKAAAYRACVAAKVRLPEELVEFFNGEPPDDTGVTIHLAHTHAPPHQRHSSCAEYGTDDGDGFQVDIEKLPPGTRFVRFVCSW